MKENIKKITITNRSAVSNRLLTSVVSQTEVIERMSERLFVYGSLKRGLQNPIERFVPDAKFVSDAELQDFSLHKVSWFPGIVESKGDKVIGEVYEIPQAEFVKLDRYESAPHLFKRQIVSTSIGDTWVYVYNGIPKEGTKVETGVWQ